MALQKFMSGNRGGAILGILAFGIFATHDVIVKQLGATYSAFQIVFFSALLSFPIITFMLMQDGQPGTLRPVHPWWVLARSVSGTLSAVFAFVALSTLELSQVYAVFFATPLVITVLAIPMLGEQVGLRRGLAVVVGLVGVLIVINPTASAFGLGHAAALLAAVLGGLNAIIVRKVGHAERSVVMVLYPMMTNFVLMGAVLPLVYKPVPLVDLALLGVVAGLVLLAMTILVAAYRRGSAVIVAPMQYSQIIWAGLFGALFFGELPGLNTYIGTAVIIVSGLYILRRESTGAVSKNTPVLRTRTRIGISPGLRVGTLLKRNRDKGQ